ncbi:MAG: RNA-binding cell elongation regulator Jag/EloR [Porcipelethomonas sp.]
MNNESAEMNSMDKSGVFSGKSVDDCKKKAAEEFGVSPEEITFKVLDEGKKGLFGKVKEEAKVWAGYNFPASVSEEETCEEEKNSEDKTDEKISAAKAYLENILKNMGIEAEVNASLNESGIFIDIDSKGSGAVIGRRGDTLDALQYLTSLVVNRIEGEYTRVSIDSCGYRSKREETLKALAKKISEKVMKSGHSTTLEPMNPYERRIIHSAVSEIEGVSSKSVGEEPYRKVVISSDNPRRRDSGRRGGGRKKFDGPRSLDLKTSFEKDYKRPKPEDDIHAGLYGKIEL